MLLSSYILQNIDNDKRSFENKSHELIVQLVTTTKSNNKNKKQKRDKILILTGNDGIVTRTSHESTCHASCHGNQPW